MHSLHAVVRYVCAVGKGIPDALGVLACGLLPGMRRPVRQGTDGRSLLGPKTGEEQRMDDSTRKRKGYLKGKEKGMGGVGVRVLFLDQLSMVYYISE